MKKLFYILVLAAGFCLLNSGWAGAQTIDSAEYFFDVDPGVGNGNPVMVTAGDTVLDTLPVSTVGLNAGFHKIYFRMKDTNNVWSLYEGSNFYLHDTIKTFSASIDSAEYFFNTDPGIDSGMSLLITPGDTVLDTIMVSTAGLAPGFHNLYTRVTDTNSVWSLYEGARFYLYDTLAASTTVSAPIDSAEYFYDTDPGIGNGLLITGFATADTIAVNDTLPTAPLTGGTHRLYVRVRDTMAVWSLYDWGTFTICNFIPVADFSADTVCQGYTTSFTDLSTNLDTTHTYTWEFNGDGVIDDTTTGNTSYTFPVSGTYTVTLIVNNTNGCMDTIIKTVHVDSLPAVSFTTPVDTICSDDTLMLSGGFPAGGVYSGPGVYGNAFYADSVTTGYHNVIYTYYNTDSCSSTAIDTVYVSPCTGIHEPAISGASIRISPNPFKTETNLSVSGNGFTMYQVSVFDVFGKQVMASSHETQTVRLERGNLASGVYFYKIAAQEKLIGSGKLVVVD